MYTHHASLASIINAIAHRMPTKSIFCSVTVIMQTDRYIIPF